MLFSVPSLLISPSTVLALFVDNYFLFLDLVALFGKQAVDGWGLAPSR
jgi:hypothetical protein